MLRRKQRSQRDAANRARKEKARARERSELPPPSSPVRSERGCTRTQHIGTSRAGTAATVSAPVVTSAGTAPVGTAVPSSAGTTAAGTATATAVTATVGSTYDTIAGSALARTAGEQGGAALRRSPQKRTPVTTSKDSSPKKKKVKSSSSSLTRRPITPTAAALTAPPAGTAFTADTARSQVSLKPKTPTKAALKSYDPTFAMRDPLMPDLFCDHFYSSIALLLFSTITKDHCFTQFLWH